MSAGGGILVDAAGHPVFFCALQPALGDLPICFVGVAQFFSFVGEPDGVILKVIASSSLESPTSK